MRTTFLNVWFLILVLIAVFLPPLVVYCGFPASMTLERTFPADLRVELSELRARDRSRHGRILQSFGGVVNFPVLGSSNPSTFGLYYTRVKLGSPPREFNVQIDTGSDVLWVACNPCDNCPELSGIGIQLGFFDPSSSTSASLVSCSDQACSIPVETAEIGCSSQNSQCAYLLKYGDGSGTSGYFVSDMLYFDTVVGESLTGNSSASIIFGCSNHQSGDLTKPNKAVDGIFGFGQQGLSVISQLSSQGLVPKVFSHCLEGKDNGGGKLVLGEIMEPGIIYSPLVASQPHYSLNLQRIAINEQDVPIDPAVFATSSNRGTIVDSGTTLAYLAEEAYDPFVSSLTLAVSQFASSVLSEGYQCFVFSGSVDDIFPHVTLYFEGGASMVLKPKDYLIQQPYVNDATIWCIGFLKALDQAITILGELVLKDKIIVYDLARQRLGWADYDCSSSVNVSLTSGRDAFVNTGELSVSSLSRDMFDKPMPTCIVSILTYVFVFAGFVFL